MSRATVRNLLRGVGCLAGLTGLAMVGGACLPATMGVVPPDGLWLALLFFPAMVGVYFVYVGYLACFRFSPRAVRHICGTLSGLCLMLVSSVLASQTVASAPWVSFVSLGCLAAALIGYRALSRGLNNWIFSGDHSG